MASEWLKAASALKEGDEEKARKRYADSPSRSE